MERTKGRTLAQSLGADERQNLGRSLGHKYEDLRDPTAVIATQGLRLGRLQQPIADEVWNRVNTDIAAFLTAVDALFADDSEENRDALLEASDRLLRATARTRMELARGKSPSMKPPQSISPTKTRKVAQRSIPRVGGRSAATE